MTAWLTQANTLVTAILALVGLVPLLLPAGLRPGLWWLPWLGLGLTAVAAVWLGRSAWRSWRLRPPGRLADSTIGQTVNIRGPRPFEDGDTLLGRDRETNSLFSMVTALDYRWGYISGEAGSGKTSLIRAGLTRRFRAAADGGRLLYLPRTGQRPDREIFARLAEALGLPAPDDDGRDDDWQKAVGAAAAASGQPTTLIVVDQFEEVFLSLRTQEARDALVAGLGALWALGRANGRIRLLFSLRKEFVDDLLSLCAAMPGLRFDDWQSRFALANLDLDVVERMIEKIAGEGELPVSRQLRPRLAADLAVDGRVRPVEFQIVLSRMLAQRIFELQAYAALGGARGIISRFIAETIEPPDRKVAEIDRQVGRHLLRALCAENFAARRPVGLGLADLESRIRDQLALAAGGTPFPAGQIRESVQRVLEEFRRARVVIEEDEDRFNLAHDYLAGPVRDATADIETAEERANRLLISYVAQSRAEKGVAVPLRALRQILRYAAPEERERTDARALLRRSKRRLAGIGGGGVVLLLALATWILPFGWQLVEWPGETLSNPRFLSKNRILLVKRRTRGVDIEDLRGNAVLHVRRTFQLSALSPDGSSILLSNRRGPTYVSERRHGFRLRAIPGESRFDDPFPDWQGYSDEGGIGFAAFASGRIYIFRDGMPPRRLITVAPPIIPLDDDGAGSIARAGDRREIRVSPGLKLSSTGRYLALVDGRGRLHMLDTRRTYDRLPPAIGAIVLDGPVPRAVGVTFSPDDRFVAWNDVAGRALVHDLRGGSTAVAIRHSTTSASLAFGPRSDRLFAFTFGRGTFNWKVGDPPQRQTVGLKVDNDIVSFDDAGRRMLIYSEGQIRSWDLARPGGARAPGVPESGVGMQQGWFCRGSETALVLGRNGRLYRLGLAAGERRAGQLLAPVEMRLAGTGQDDRILLFGQGLLAVGRCGDGELRTLRTDQMIRDVFVGHDPRDLILMTDAGTLRVRQSFFLWGLPLWSREWPALAPGFR